MGRGAAASISHTFFQNLLRSDICNTVRIVPDWQDIRVGDTVWLASPTNLGERAPKFLVNQVVPEHALVLLTPPDARETASLEASWAFVLERKDSGATRLRVRYRSFSEPALMASALSLEPLAFAMEWRMLLGIKERAERAWANLSGVHWAGPCSTPVVG